MKTSYVKPTNQKIKQEKYFDRIMENNWMGKVYEDLTNRPGTNWKNALDKNSWTASFIAKWSQDPSRSEQLDLFKTLVSWNDSHSQTSTKTATVARESVPISTTTSAQTFSPTTTTVATTPPESTVPAVDAESTLPAQSEPASRDKGKEEEAPQVTTSRAPEPPVPSLSSIPIFTNQSLKNQGERIFDEFMSKKQVHLLGDALLKSSCNLNVLKRTQWVRMLIQKYAAERDPELQQQADILEAIARGTYTAGSNQSEKVAIVNHAQPTSVSKGKSGEAAQVAVVAKPQKKAISGRLMDKQWARIEEILNNLEEGSGELNLTSEQAHGIINRNKSWLKQRGWKPSEKNPFIFTPINYTTSQPSSVISSMSSRTNNVPTTCSNARLNSVLPEIRNNTISELNLEGCDLNDDDAVVLAKALQTNRTLRELKLGNNKISARGAQVLAERLSTNVCAVHLVDLSNNNLGDDGAIAFAIALRNKKSKRNLADVNLSGNSIGWRGAQALAEGIKGSSSLRRVNISHNSLGVEGFAALGSALERHSSLADLNLAATGLDNDGVRELANGLVKNLSLVSLDLSQNPLGYTGGVELAKVISQVYYLRSLNLVNTNLFDVPAGGNFSELSGIFQDTNSLRLIDVSGNHIDNEHMLYLAEWVGKVEHWLDTLKMRNCGINDQAIELFCAFIEDKKRRLSIDFDENPITNAGIETIIRAVGEGTLRAKTLTESKTIPLTDEDRARLDNIESLKSGGHIDLEVPQTLEAPAKAEQPEATSYPENLEDYKALIQAREETYPDAFQRLDLDEGDDMMCVVSYEIPEIPVRLGKQLYDLKSLEGLSTRLDPFARTPFTMSDVIPAIDVAELFDEMIKQAEDNNG